MKNPLNILLLCLFGFYFLFDSAYFVQAQSENQSKYIGHPNGIPNSYIVVLEDWAAGPRGPGSRTPNLADDLSKTYGGKVRHTFQFSLNGYSVEMSENEALLLSQDARVKYVEQNMPLRLAQTPTLSWGLNRIDQRNLPLDNAYNFTSTGSSVNVYVIDSGIKISHVEFGGRAFPFFNAFDDGLDSQDPGGHGTHIAGIIGGTRYGVAKNTKLFSVKVLDEQAFGTAENFLQGINYVAEHKVLPAVVNISLTVDDPSMVLDGAVANIISQGLTVVTAAGNDSGNACDFSPARVPEAITVGATNQIDSVTDYSNFGGCVDIFAPGHQIVSAWSLNNTASTTRSGTSQASAHLAGVAALFLQRVPDAAPQTVANFIANTATNGVLSDVGSDSPNKLLYSILHNGNGIDESRLFIRQQYLDFLEREPDQAGGDYWVGQLEPACVSPFSPLCNNRRHEISAAFFIEQEFQESGAFVFRLYKSAFGETLNYRPSFAEFLPDRRRVIGGANLLQRKRELAADFALRQNFLTRYPASQSPSEFVDALLLTVKRGTSALPDLSDGLTFTESERQGFINDVTTEGRQVMLVNLADHPNFRARLFNRAFVLTQYFGYLRRDPDQAGYDFWLKVLNQQPNNSIGMVCAFVTSEEYQKRFGSDVTRTNAVCNGGSLF